MNQLQIKYVLCFVLILLYHLNKYDIIAVLLFISI